MDRCQLGRRRSVAERNDASDHEPDDQAGASSIGGGRPGGEHPGADHRSSPDHDCVGHPETAFQRSAKVTTSSSATGCITGKFGLTPDHALQV